MAFDELRPFIDIIAYDALAALGVMSDKAMDRHGPAPFIKQSAMVLSQIALTGQRME